MRFSAEDAAVGDRVGQGAGQVDRHAIAERERSVTSVRAHRNSHRTMAAKSTQAARQYSAASMIVRTRTVWRGSLGSSLPQASVGS